MGWKRKAVPSGDYPIKGRSSFCLAAAITGQVAMTEADMTGCGGRPPVLAGMQGGSGLVGPGLHDAGRHSLYRTFFFADAGMVCGDGIRQMGHEPFHGIRPLLTDLIAGKKNPYENLFTPSRLGWNGAVNLAKQAGCSLKGYVGRKKVTAGEYLEDLEPGEGHLVEYGKGKIGAYRDEEGALHLVTARCPHLGCELTWNPDEKSWDCPCHGSRFDYEGRCWTARPEGIGLCGSPDGTAGSK